MNIDQIKQDLQKYRELCDEAIEEAKKHFIGIINLKNLDLREVYLKIDEEANQTTVMIFDFGVGNDLNDFLFEFINKKTGNKNIEIITEW